MNILSVYKIISYILLPIAAFLGMMVLFMIMLALGNPGVLFSLFLVAGTVIYIFSSFGFLQNGIVRGLKLRPALKDWIKVNGYVALFFACAGLVQAVVVIIKPDIMKQAVESMASIVPAGQEIDTQKMEKLAMGFQYFFLVIFILLFTHIIMSFRLIKKYAALFNS